MGSRVAGRLRTFKGFPTLSKRWWRTGLRSGRAKTANGNREGHPARAKILILDDALSG